MKKKLRKIISVLLSFSVLSSSFAAVVLAVDDAAIEKNSVDTVRQYTNRYLIKYKRERKKTLQVETAFQVAKQEKNNFIEKASAHLEEQADSKELDAFQQSVERQNYRKSKLSLLRLEETQSTLLPPQFEQVQVEEPVDPEVFIAELTAANEEIEYVQPDYMMELSSSADEDVTINLILTDEGIIEEKTAASAQLDVDLPEPSDLPSEAAVREVTVALLDTGVDTAHPDLEGRLVNSYDFVKNSAEIQAQEGSLEYAHGTHMAGTILNNALNAKVMPLKVFENGRAYTSDIIEAISYAKEHGAELVNCSWGSANENLALKEAMEESGLTFICAAGNHGINIEEKPCYPAAFDLENIISVASVNDDYALSYFSNFGANSVDIAAPGRDIEGAYPGGKYGIISGTSVSAAYVSGAAANGIGIYGASDIKAALLNSADQVSGLSEKVLNGNVLNTANLYEQKPGRVIDSQAVDEFSIERTMEENLGLFAQYNNVAVYTTGNHPIFLKGNGSVWTINNEGYPEQIQGLKNIIKLYADGGSIIAIDGSGQAYASDIFNYENPNSIKNTGLSGVIEVSTSGNSFLALTQDGYVWGWGQNESGQAGGDDLDWWDDGQGNVGDNGFKDVYDPILIGMSITEPGYGTPLSNIKKICADGSVSYAIDNNDKLYGWGWLGRPTPIPEELEQNVVFATGGWNERLVIKTNGTVVYGWTNQAVLSKNVVKLYHNVVLYEDGTFDTINVNEGALIFEEGQLTGVKDVAASPYYSYIGGTRFYAAIKNDDTVWVWGDNSNHAIDSSETTYISNPIRLFKEEQPSGQERVIVDEQYNTAGNLAYHLNQAGLEKLGWSEKDIATIDTCNPANGGFSAESGALIMKKTSDRITSPTETAQEIVYAIERTFTDRHDNWKGDPRVSMWTQHFKGNYQVQMNASFNNTYSQAYYDLWGANSAGVRRPVVRYRVDPWSDGAFSVYNFYLNSPSTMLYPIWTNCQKTRTITTAINSENATFQTFENSSTVPAKTTVADANPKDTFNLSSWTYNGPSPYMSSIRILSQAQASKNDTIATIHSLKLIENYAMHDIVDDAIEALSMADVTDTPACVAQDLKALPSSLSGADITWHSSNPAVLRDDGTLTGAAVYDTDVVMTAKITNPRDKFTKNLDFRLTIVKKDGFAEKFDKAVTGKTAVAGGTAVFPEYPMWTFSYPGLTNGMNKEVHDSQVFAKDGYLVFKKISDRQTASYQECLVGVRELDRSEKNPIFTGAATLEFTARAHGTGTFKIAPMSSTGKIPFVITLDASVKKLNIEYAEEIDGQLVNQKQVLATVDVTAEHTYKLAIDTHGTFEVYVDNKAVATENGAARRNFLAGTADNFNLSKVKAWISNITFANTEVSYLKNIIFTKVEGQQALAQVTLNCKDGKYFDITLSVDRAKLLSTQTYRINFDFNYLEVEDLMGQTYEKETAAGTYEGINISKAEAGTVDFNVTGDRTTATTVWVGPINQFRFKGKLDGTTKIYFEKIDSEN